MVFGSTSVSEANTVGWERLRSDQSVFTRALLTRNSMSSDGVVSISGWLTADASCPSQVGRPPPPIYSMIL